MVFADGTVKVPKDFGDLIKPFDSLEAGAEQWLNAFMEDAKIKLAWPITLKKPLLIYNRVFHFGHLKVQEAQFIHWF